MAPLDRLMGQSQIITLNILPAGISFYGPFFINRLFHTNPKNLDTMPPQSRAALVHETYLDGGLQ